ncbi:MAG TPA: universal stress protein [Bacillota bacterium]|nr:universal stress protein [Bacillota bacterium]
MNRNILLASDGSENALRAAGFTADLAAMAPETKVTVLVVNDILERMKYYSPLQSPVIFEEVETLFREKSEEALEKTVEIFKKNKCPVEGVVRVGNPAHVIVEFAREGGFDHIVIGSRGMGSLKGIVMGSVSSKVINLAPCPVTVVK